MRIDVRFYAVDPYPQNSRYVGVDWSATDRRGLKSALDAAGVIVKAAGTQTPREYREIVKQAGGYIPARHGLQVDMNGDFAGDFPSAQVSLRERCPLPHKNPTSSLFSLHPLLFTHDPLPITHHDFLI